jgi:hypothetical protein
VAKRSVSQPSHPLLTAITPLLDRIDATVVDPDRLGPDDVPLTWDGAVIAGIRLSATGSSQIVPSAAEPGRSTETGKPAANVDSEAAIGLDGILADLEVQFGSPLAELPRPRKQEAVRMLEEVGAFSYRKSVETVAAALGISRFTVYNYLNRDRT